MRNEDLLNLLYSINSNLQRCMTSLHEVDVEQPIDDRPSTEDWKKQAHEAMQWYNDIHDLLQSVRPRVARRIGRPVKQWTPKEMIALLTENENAEADH